MNEPWALMPEHLASGQRGSSPAMQNSHWLHEWAIHLTPTLSPTLSLEMGSLMATMIPEPSWPAMQGRSALTGQSSLITWRSVWLSAAAIRVELRTAEELESWQAQSRVTYVADTRVEDLDKGASGLELVGLNNGDLLDLEASGVVGDSSELGLGDLLLGHCCLLVGWWWRGRRECCRDCLRRAV